MISLPDPIAAYLKAANANDASALIACFTADAVVQDEAKEFQGVQAISTWQAESNRRYRPAVEAQRIEGAGQDYRLYARVTGDFPGSPAMLTYSFVLRGDRIASLEIGV